MRGKRQEIILWIAVISAGVILMVASIVFGLVFLTSPWQIVPFFVAVTFVNFGTQAFTGWRILHLRRLHCDADGRICPKCGHLLVGLEDEGTCPECGTPFNLADVKRQWQSIIGEERRKKPVPDNRE